MTDHAHDMGLAALLVDGVAHRLAVDGEALIDARVKLVPAPQGAVEMVRIDTDEDIPEDELARHQVAPLPVTTSEALAGLGAEALRPIRDRLVSAHATQCGSGGKGQNGGEPVTPPLGATRVGDVREKLRQGSHLIGTQHEFGGSVTVGWSKKGPRQQGLGTGVQRTDKDHLGRLRKRAITPATSAKALGGTQAQPVGRFVDGAWVTPRVDKGFQQQQRMTEALQPILADSFFA